MAPGLAALGAPAAAAETCGGTYTVKSGDTLSGIADRFYRDAGMWTAIHRNNLSVIGPLPEHISAGMKIKLACLDGLPRGLESGAPLTDIRPASARTVQVQPGRAAVRKKIDLLTGSDYAPFTDKKAHNGGLLTEVVEAAMTQAAPEQGFAIHWVDDWASHFDPLLSNALLDMGFPWFKPDCEAMPENDRCQNLLFSDPMFELLILLFADAQGTMAYNTDADIEGKTLCRPAGRFTFDLDQYGRRWLLDSKITLKQPRGVKDCLDMVLRGEADAMALNEFTGRAAIKEYGLQDRIRILPQPLSVERLHVVVHKAHPDAKAFLAMFNEGLRGIRRSGEYQRIVEDHMAGIWADF